MISLIISYRHGSKLTAGAASIAGALVVLSTVVLFVSRSRLKAFVIFQPG